MSKRTRRRRCATGHYWTPGYGAGNPERRYNWRMTTIHRQLVTFPTSQPAGTALAHVELDRAVAEVPTWSIHTLTAGPRRSSPGYDQHLRDTVGSSYDWSDEIRFDKQTGRLASFVLKMPEAGGVEPGIARSWLALPRQAGIPVLDNRETGFHVDPVDLRWLADDGGALVAMDANMPVADSSSLRLAISNQVDLVFHRGSYGGWILLNPVAHLVAASSDEVPGADDPRLHDLLREYLGLVIEPHVGRMCDEDPEIYSALQALCARSREIDCVQARALLRSVERVLEIFYYGYSG